MYRGKAGRFKAPACAVRGLWQKAVVGIIFGADNRSVRFGPNPWPYHP